MASDPPAVLAAIKARCKWVAIEQVAWEAYPRFDSDRGKRIAFRAGAAYLRPDVPLLADALQAVLDLVAEWDQYAGPGSEAERVFGKQVVSVPFAVDKVRETITTALAKGETS